MAKEKADMSKEERKALKAAKKEAKASKPEGVTKPAKEDKKSKKEKTKLAERALKEIQNKPAASANGVESEEEAEDGEAEEVIVDKKGTTRPVGALVPFANPLADEKVGKKVFKSVKKGLWCSFYDAGNCADTTDSSCGSPIAQTRRQGSRQGAAEVADR